MTGDAQPTTASTRLTPRLVLLFAIACGVSVANLYYAQPLLATIAHAFHTGSGTSGLIMTFSQIGYALGLALLVPLGDLLPRRRLVPGMLMLTTVALLVSSVAPAISVLVLAGLLIGLGSVVAQVLVPMAASMADDASRGRVVGSVMSGLLIGILLARSVSGILASLTSWRVVFVAAAVLTVALAAILALNLPRESPRPRLSYDALLTSTLRLLRDEPLLRRRAFLGALAFAAFSVFWTTVAFLLSGPPFHYGDLVIGLFGLAGAAGALCANLAGRWADRELHHRTTVLFAGCIALSFVLLWLGRHNIPVLIAGILVLDAGVQGMHITNQSLIYRLAPEARSRTNSAYMVLYFAGGAVASAAAGAAYSGNGWAGVCVLGGAVGAAGVLTGLWHVLRTLPARVRLDPEGC